MNEDIKELANNSKIVSIVKEVSTLPKDLVSLPYLMKTYHTSKTYIYSLAHSGRIKVYKMGMYKVSEAEFCARVIEDSQNATLSTRGRKRKEVVNG